MKNTLRLTITLIIAALALAACDTGDSATDPTSAQSLQPSPNGFSREVANDIVEDFAMVAAAGSGATGNIPVAAALERIGTALECLEDAGAVSAMIYRQEDGGAIPQAGISLLVNSTRVERNILNCVTQLPFESQSLADAIQPCVESGSFSNSGEDFFYAYAGVGDSFCDQVGTYFTNLSTTS